MALGGGVFLTQNKILPGAYINFISLASASATLSDRGVAAIGIANGWGVEGEIFEVTSGDFQKNSMKLLGYSYDADALKGLRDLFRNARMVYLYRLDGGGDKAFNLYGTAKYGGTGGNKIKIVIAVNADDNTKSDVSTYFNLALVDKQTVLTADKTTALVDNDYVVWADDVTLTPTTGLDMTGGSDITVTATQHQAFLDALESYSFNALGVVDATAAINNLYVAFCKRLRDEMGIKFQVVVHNTAADFEGAVNVKNSTSDAGWPVSSLVYWVLGVIAGTAVNKSALNKKYDGEFTVGVAYTQQQLEAAILAGEFTIHRVGSDLRVLSDINSLVTTTVEKGDIFKENQTIRVIDQIANDIAVLFNTKYLGVVPNDEAGRISLWADIVKHHEQLQEIRAIQNFKDTDVVVERGNTPKSVYVTDYVTVVNAMAQLYMLCIIG